MATLFSLPVSTLCNLQVTVRLGQNNIDKLSLNLEPINDAPPPTSTRIIGDEGESKISFQLTSDASGPMLTVFASNEPSTASEDQFLDSGDTDSGSISSPVAIPVQRLRAVEPDTRFSAPPAEHQLLLGNMPSDQTGLPLMQFGNSSSSEIMLPESNFQHLHRMDDSADAFTFDLQSMDAFHHCLASGFTAPTSMTDFDPSYSKLPQPNQPSPVTLSPAMSGIMSAGLSSPSSTSSPFYLDNYIPTSASSDSAATSDSESVPVGPSRRACKRRRFSCSYEGCTRRFTSHYTLKLHQDAHKPKERQWYTCTAGCSEHFSRQHDRLRHEVAKHGKVCDWICNECQRFFSSSRTLGNHKCPGQAGETKGSKGVYSMLS